MPTCPACSASCVHGSLVCPRCGEDLDAAAVAENVPVTRALMVVGVGPERVYTVPKIDLHLIMVEERVFPEHAIVATMPIRRLEVPVRIGRNDLSKSPPILPELDLGQILAELLPGKRPVVSRLHAALQLKDGRPVIKHLVASQNSTWIQRGKRLSAVPINAQRELEHRDTLILGDPLGRYVALRVILSDPR
ncbi:FHA domain-containing protein [Candidatus Uhrbacteria bacterium]|nr:FHA domain-containing protein [Candidatus Uhrbacteria bacterium]